MSANSKIEWTDHTFNPWIGCTKVSPACDHCYAEVSTPCRTLGVSWGAGEDRRRTSEANWKEPLRWNANHDKFFAEHGRRQRVFCASLADVFDNEVPNLWRQNLMSLIADTPNLDWLLLTKRIGNVERMLQEACLHDGRLMDASDRYRPLENVWIGATIANQEEADRDIPKLLQVHAAVRFLSMEPLLGPVDLSYRAAKALPIYWEGTEADGPMPYHDGLTGRHLFDAKRRGWAPYSGRGVDWVIVGGESGPHARPMHPDWARSLRDQCAAAGVPFLFKQWGEWLGEYQDGATDHDPMEINASPWSVRVGKKAAGRLLDGRTHDEFPKGAA
jgi:protein gp37